MNDLSGYARQIETYLCQKNGGRLIRVVGPAFDLVCGWASRGVPLRVAFRGIDRCCERQDAKARRRPIPVEFCDADVLDAFDDWRRAVGVAAVLTDEGAKRGEPPSRKQALAAHLERVIARLAHARSRPEDDAAMELHRHIDGTVRELEELVTGASRARGEARASIIARLHELDGTLIAAATQALSAARTAELRNEAARELAPFGSRMPPAARERAVQLAFERLVREALGLPTLTYE